MTDNGLIAEWLGWKGNPPFDVDTTLWHGNDGLLAEIEDKGWFWWCKFCVSLLIDFYNSGTTRPSFEWGDKGFRDLSVYDAGGFMKAIMRATPAQLTAALIAVIKEE